MKNSFILYHEYQEHFNLLTDEELGKFMRVIFDYEINGTLPDNLPPMQKMAFSFIKKDLDDNREKYNVKIEANKANGSKGGRPKTESDGNPENPDEPKKAVSVSDTVSDTVSDFSNGDIARADAQPAPKKTDKPVKQYHRHGQYGWIKLTDDELSKLCKDYGETAITHYIEYIDEYAQTTKNKNGYSDWNLVIRKAIREKWGEPKPQARASPEQNYYTEEERQERLKKLGVI